MVSQNDSINHLGMIIGQIRTGSCTKCKPDYIQTIQTIYGPDKVRQVCARYNLSHCMENAKPLMAKHVKQIQVGLNDINTSDLDQLLLKLKHGTFLSLRERDGLNTLGSDKQNELKNYPSSSGLPPTLFNDLITALKEPRDEYRSLCPERSLRIADVTALPGRYFQDGWVSHKSGRALEDEERLRICEEIEQLAPDQYIKYIELISKILVKKHLYYEQEGSNVLKLGMLVPALKGADAKPRWYRIDDMIDSGWGKLAYRLVPATIQYSDDMPEIIIYRSSAALPTALDSVTSYLQDFNVYPPGYLSRNVCMGQELSWITDATASPNGKMRPLIITGHSLGGSLSQIAVINLQKSGKKLNRKISLELFDSPAIRAKDAKAFAKWYDKQDNISHPISFNYYVSKFDPVPLAGDVVSSSYLGSYIKSSHVASVHQLELTKIAKKKMEIAKRGPHSTIYFRGTKGIDFKETVVSIQEFDKVNARSRAVFNASKLFVGAFVWSTLGTIGGMKRLFFGRRHHDPAVKYLFKYKKS